MRTAPNSAVLRVRMTAALDRINTATVVKRLREEERHRAALHGGTAADLEARIAAAVKKLEEAADLLG